MQSPCSGPPLELPTLFVAKITATGFASLAGILALVGAAAGRFDWNWRLVWLPFAGGTAGLLYQMAVEIPRKLAGAYGDHRLQSALAAAWMLAATLLGSFLGFQTGQTAGWSAAGLLAGGVAGWCVYTLGALFQSV